MSEAGYSESKPLQLSLTYANIYGTEIGDQLRSQLKKIGIDLKVNVVEFSTWLQDVYTNRNYDISLVDHNESHDFYQWADPTYYYNYDNKEVQTLYAKASPPRTTTTATSCSPKPHARCPKTPPPTGCSTTASPPRTRRASPASRSTSTRPCCRCTTSPTPSDG